VRVPPGVAPGSTINIQVPDEPGRVLSAQVPPNASEFNLAYYPSNAAAAIPTVTATVAAPTPVVTNNYYGAARPTSPPSSSGYNNSNNNYGSPRRVVGTADTIIRVDMAVDTTVILKEDMVVVLVPGLFLHWLVRPLVPQL
jgi:hypothetical protein